MSVSPIQFMKEINRIFGLRDVKTLSIDASLGEPVSVTVTKLLDLEESQKLVELMEKYRLVELEVESPSNRCPDCDAPVDWEHHIGCDIPHCATCGDQLWFGCQCPMSAEKLMQVKWHGDRDEKYDVLFVDDDDDDGEEE